MYVRYAYAVRPQVTKEVLTMAGFPSSLTREDLEFMADDIGRDMIAVMKPEDILKGMDAEKQQRLLSLFSIEELLKGISAQQRKALFEVVLKTLASNLADKENNN